MQVFKWDPKKFGEAPFGVELSERQKQKIAYWILEFKNENKPKLTVVHREAAGIVYFISCGHLCSLELPIETPVALYLLGNLKKDLGIF